MEIKTTTVLTGLVFLWYSFLEISGVKYITLFCHITSYFHNTALVLDFFLLFVTLLWSMKLFACLKLTLS